MNYTYEEIINNLNEGKIESIIFSIKEYTHYKKCIIKRCVDCVSNEKNIIRIEAKLAEDDSETVSFYKYFKEDYKLFKFGRKGAYTLKQVWDNVQILQINYYETLLNCSLVNKEDKMKKFNANLYFKDLLKK